MDEALYQQVLLALQVTHCVTSSPSERNAAYAFCEEFKQREDSALYAVAIYKNPTLGGGMTNTLGGKEEMISTRQHFALHLLENYVLTRWSQLPLQEQVQLRTELINLFLLSVPQQKEPIYVKEKKVSLLAQIAKRQFPQRWPDFLPELINIWQQPSSTPYQIELILLVLRSLAEDCVSSNFNTSIPPARRKDILQGLNVCLPQLFPAVYQELEKQFVLYTNTKDETSIRLILAALHMLKEFLDWMPLEKAIDPTNGINNSSGSSGSNLIFVCISLVDQKEFRLAAMECLEVYLTRTFGKEQRDLMIQTMQQIITKMETVPPFEKELSTDNDCLEKNLKFHKKLNDVFVAFGTYQLEVYLTGGHILTHEQMVLLTRILHFMSRLYAHPSLLLTETQIGVWSNLLKHKTIQQFADQILLTSPMNNINTMSVLDRLRRVSFEKYFKLNSPEREIVSTSLSMSSSTQEQLAIACSVEEFDDHYEYTSFYGNFRGRLYALIRLLVLLNPQIALQMLIERLDFVLTNFPMAKDHFNPRSNFCTENSTTFLYHEGITSLIDCVIKQLPLNQLQNPLVHTLVEKLLAFNTQDPLLKYRQLFVLSSFAKYYATEQGKSLLTLIFEKLFVEINYRQPQEQALEELGKLCNESMNVRRRSLASLVSICQAIPAQILPVLPILCSRVQELFQKDQVLDSEGVLLYEMLVLVSNSMPNQEERKIFIQQIVQEPLTQWTSAEMTLLVQNPQNLIQAIENGNHAIVFRIVKTLTTLYGIAKRCHDGDFGSNTNTKPSIEQQTFGPIWPHLMPNLLNLIRCLHLFGADMTLKEQILKMPSACWLLSVSLDEIAQLLGGRHQLVEEEVAKLPIESKWSKWHKNVRDVCYHLMGIALSETSFYAGYGDVQGCFQNALLFHLDEMDHRHVKSCLAYFVLPFLKNCPRELYPSLLEPVLTHLIQHLSQRFKICFNSLTSSQKKDSKWNALIVGVEQAKHEVAQEKMLMDLTRQVMEFLEACIDAKTVVGTDTDTPKHVTLDEDTFLMKFLLKKCSTIAFLMGQIFISVICWKDTLSCRRSVHLSDKMVNVLHEETKFYGLFGQEIFTACLKALFMEEKDHVKEDGLKWDLINLVRNIYCRLTLGLVPVEECKGFDPCNQPVKPLSTLCPFPRQIFLSLQDVLPSQVDTLDQFLREKHSIKTQKNAIKEFLEVPMLAYRKTSGGLPTLGAFAVSMKQNALENQKQIQDLPEKLILSNKEMETAAKTYEANTTNLDVSHLFSGCNTTGSGQP